MAEPVNVTVKDSMSPGIPSPCQNVCQIHPQTGYCIGCMRTLDEIADWLEMSDEEKCRLLEKLEQRRVET